VASKSTEFRLGEPVISTSARPHRTVGFQPDNGVHGSGSGGATPDCSMIRNMPRWALLTQDYLPFTQKYSRNDIAGLSQRLERQGRSGFHFVTRKAPLMQPGPFVDL
jgi:hypothetical protein